MVDVYRGEVAAQKSFPALLLYVSLFHQCIAGPIVRYKDINAELLQRRATRGDISYGVTRFTVGLAKKAVLANACGALADQLLVAGTVPAADRPWASFPAQRRCWRCGWAFWRSCCRSISTFPLIPTWPSAWAA